MTEFKVGDRVCYKHQAPCDNVEVGEVGTICGISEVTGKYGVAFETKDIYKHSCDGLCRDNYGWWCDENTLEPADNIVRMADGTIIADFRTGGFCDGFRGGKIAYAPNGAPLFWKPEPEKPVSIEEQLGLPKGVSIHDLPTSEWYNSMSGELIVSHTEMERAMDRLLKALEKPSVKFGIKNFEQKLKEKKNLKFTFYFNVNEGTRVDKSCNGTIPTITTSVVLDKFGDPDRRKCYSLEGEATCDKADYDMRQGVLEALANAVFDGNFEKAYDKAVKTNAFCERQDRTCHYCGKVLDTIEEKQAHEAWHVERKKARRERYLLRKRAKEIAFEEQAQKMAKDMLKAKEKSDE